MSTYIMKGINKYGQSFTCMSTLAREIDPYKRKIQHGLHKTWLERKFRNVEDVRKMSIARKTTQQDDRNDKQPEELVGMLHNQGRIDSVERYQRKFLGKQLSTVRTKTSQIHRE